MKTQDRPLEIVSKLGEFSIEVSCLLTERYRLVSQSIASYVVFEGDFWGATDVEFSHSLGRKRTLIPTVFGVPERPLLGKADIRLDLPKRSANDPKRTFGDPLPICHVATVLTSPGTRSLNIFANAAVSALTH